MHKSQKIFLKRLKRRRLVDGRRKALNVKRYSVFKKIRLIETRQAQYEEEAKNQGGQEGQNAKGASRIQNWLSAFRVKKRPESDEPGTSAGDSAQLERTVEEKEKIAYEEKENSIGFQVPFSQEIEDRQESEAGERVNSKTPESNAVQAH